MRIYILATRDIVANVYGQPQFGMNLQHAIRAFVDECTVGDPQSLLMRHPEHFELWIIGEYDDELGVVSPYEDERRTQLVSGAGHKRNN